MGAALITALPGAACARDLETFEHSGESALPVYYITGGLGVFFLGDDSLTAPNGLEVIHDASPRAAAQAAVGMTAHRHLSLEGQLGVWSARWDGFDDAALAPLCPSVDPSDCADPDVRTHAFTANVLLTAPLDARWRPYGGVGAGVMSTDLGVDGVDSMVSAGYLAKGGLDVAVRDHARLGVEAVYLGAPTLEAGALGEISVAGFSILGTMTGVF